VLHINGIPSSASKIKVLNKQPLVRPRTRWRDQVREDILKRKGKEWTDTRGALMGGLRE
jgi:hypothetical protein